MVHFAELAAEIVSKQTSVATLFCLSNVTKIKVLFINRDSSIGVLRRCLSIISAFITKIISSIYLLSRHDKHFILPEDLQ